VRRGEARRGEAWLWRYTQSIFYGTGTSYARIPLDYSLFYFFECVRYATLFTAIQDIGIT
jgi:hypothetical protein